MLDLYPKLSLLSSYLSISWNDAQASPQKHPEDTVPATDSQLESVHGSPKNSDEVGIRAPVSPASSLPSSASKVSDEVTFRELNNIVFWFPRKSQMNENTYILSREFQTIELVYSTTWLQKKSRRIVIYVYHVLTSLCLRDHP